ncbi:MAG: DUF2971 domain-containing protein [Pseudomonadota bacterium]
MAERTTVYYADPDSFNDPLDCNPGIQLWKSKADIQNVLKSFYSESNKNEMVRFKKLLERLWYLSGNPDYASNKLKNRDRIYRQSLSNEIKKHLGKYFSGTGVLSMARSHSSMLMWSHYADNHKGVCLGYDINRRHGQRVYRARYDLPRKIPFELIEDWRLGGSTSAEKELRAHFFLTKSKDWVYENEYRLLRSPDGKESGIGADYAPSEIAEVMFGLYCDFSVKVAMVRLLDNSSKKVKFFDMTTKASSFELRRSRIETGELLASSPGLSKPALMEGFERIKK